jgi:beta-N-acetylhexosaminidase
MTKPSISRSRRNFLSLAGMAAGAVAVSCLGSGDSDAPAASGTSAPEASPGAAATSSPQASTANSASLEEMIGQMLMIGFRGLSLGPEEPIYNEIVAGRVGNVVLFDYDVPGDGLIGRNVQSPAQVKLLVQKVQSLSKTPQLVAIDQEGGLVARLKPEYGFQRTLSAEQVGGLNDLTATRQQGAATAAMMAQAGINLNLAPVVDVNVDPENPIIGAIGRSFSSDPEVVARQALAFIEGHHDQGVLTTLKHFPGHGSSEADSHLGFVDVTSTWSDKELIPFRRVIEAGKADAVMTAHIFNSHWDPVYPATLSKLTITGILRDRLGFDGVIITDDMQMGAISNYYPFAQAVEASILAGADIVAIANNGTTYNPTVGAEAFAAIMSAVRAGRITEQRIEQSYRRITALKERL